MYIRHFTDGVPGCQDQRAECLLPAPVCLLKSRALGDFQYKDENRKPEDCKVTAVPDTQSVLRSDDDEFLLVACDGVWDVMSNEVSGRAVLAPPAFVGGLPPP